MNEDDKELEQLKKKRLAEMEKNISFKQQKKEEISSKKNQPSPREILVKNLGYRGLEVLQNAEYQFPNETKIVIVKLVELINSGDINEKLDGGKLLALFRAVGLDVHMQTKINIEQDGKFVSISEKLSKKSSSKNEIQNKDDDSH